MFKNKQIIFVVCGLLVLAFGAAVYLQLRRSSQMATPDMAPARATPTASPLVAENDAPANGWAQYEHSVLGIKFRYPEKWGKPYTEPARYITDLSTVVKDYDQEDNSYYNSVYVRFPLENTPIIHFFNESYGGNRYYNAEAHKYGYIDNIPELKKTGDICTYKVNFDHTPAWSDTDQEIYATCGDGIKTYLIKNIVQFDQPKYSYWLNHSAFKKMQNGYFDNVLIDYYIASLWQTDKDSISLPEFLKETKAEAQYQKNRQDFVEFARSVESFKPAPKQVATFDQSANEDPNITTIRRYYFLLTAGKLREAYDMYAAKKVTFSVFQQWYQNTLTANPYQFKKVTDTRYNFDVDLQDNNKPVEKYRVAMEVQNGKVNTLSAEKLIGEESKFGNLSAFVKNRQGRNFVVLRQNGQEQIIDQAGDDPIKDIQSLRFYDPVFSPQGSYLTYTGVGWEWSLDRVYDIKNKKIRLRLDSPFLVAFTPDEKNLVACADDHFIGARYGIVYSLPDFKVDYDVLDAPENSKYFTLDCKYDKDRSVIRYSLSELWDEATQKTDESKKKIIEFSLVDRRIKVVE